jgi:hypothetical protein
MAKKKKKDDGVLSAAILGFVGIFALSRLYK